LSVYLDASVLVALFSNEPFTPRARALLQSQTPVLMVSDFAAAEVASAVARQIRMGQRPTDEGRNVLSAFDTWTARATQRVQIESGDITVAEAFLRRLDLPLRAPDAIHLATAARMGAAVATFDVGMARCASILGVAVAPI
jgi:predicted nucleic acid-binding protein